MFSKKMVDNSLGANCQPFFFIIRLCYINILALASGKAERYIADVAATSHPYTQLHTPKRSTPTVQRARAVRVAQSLWNVAIGVSVLLMYIHFTIFK